MKISKNEIEQAVAISDLKNYRGTFTELGGGEINNTFLLDCEPEPVILRIAKDTDQNTLIREAEALTLLDSSYAPNLIFFDESQKINNRYWILESHVKGKSVPRLSISQFENLGSILAHVHTHKTGEVGVNLWKKLLWASQMFGTEEYLMSHPDVRLRRMIQHAKELFAATQEKFNSLPMTLIHGDATPGNILVNGDSVALIDWELSQSNDAMAEFSTVYYEDIEYNRGKWRIKISPDEKHALFRGYERSNGIIDEERIRFWIHFDKLGASIFLYWRIHESGRVADEAQIAQYQVDLDNLVASLEQNL